MPSKIDELLKNEKWMKENRLKKKQSHEEAERQKEEEMERERLANVRKYEGHGFDPNTEAFKTPASESSENSKTASKNYWKLGHTGPKPQFDSWPQGGNAYPRRRRREHPSGHHNCGFY